MLLSFILRREEHNERIDSEKDEEDEEALRGDGEIQHAAFCT